MDETQAIERRRIARELHDQTGQLLTSIGLALGRLKRGPQGEVSKAIHDIEALLSAAHREIRTISFLAHPPELATLGLADTLQAFARGFGQRTNLRVSFGIDAGTATPDDLAAGAIYRIAQESLSNIHRHASAANVSISLSTRRLGTHLVIVDDGIGISPETIRGGGSAGVGIGGMRSRMLEVSGRLTVRRLSIGTAIIATLPNRKMQAVLGTSKS